MDRSKVSRSDKIKGLFRKRSKSSSITPHEQSIPSPEHTSADDAEKQKTSLSLVQVDSKLSDISSSSEKTSELEPEPSQPIPVPGKRFTVDVWKQARGALTDQERQLLDGCRDEKDGESVLLDLQKLAGEKRRATEAKAWKIDFGGRRIVMKDVAGKIASWVKAFTEVGDTLAQVDPVHAALPWAVVKTILQVVTADQTQMGLILIGLEQVTCLTARSKLYQRLYLDDIEPRNGTHADVMKELVDRLSRLYAKLFSFLAYYVRLLDRSGPSSALQAFIKPDEVSDMLSEIGSHEQKVATAANLCEKQASIAAIDRTDQNFKETRQQLRELMYRLDSDMVQFWKKLNEDARCKIMQWVSDIAYESDHYIARKGRTEGTGEWLLENGTYKTWRETEESTILWLNGIPGAGKTKLSSKVVDDVLGVLASDDDGNRAFAYFYCDRNRADHRDPVAILRSLVRQLCAPRDNSCIEDCVEAKYEERRRKGFARDRLMGEECHDLLLQLVSAFTETYLVIDGLDECERETRHVVMDAMDEMVAKSSHPVKIYIASRTDTDLRKRYEGRAILEITAKDNQADIETFVLERMDHSEFCRKKMSRKVRDQVLTTFRSKSQGMFQWAMLHIGELLELKRNNDILKYLDGLPKGLEATYDSLYQQISNQIGSKGDVAFAALKVLMVSTRPLSPDELVIAVTQDPEADFCLDEDVDIEYVLGACFNLLVVADGSLERSVALDKDNLKTEDQQTGGYMLLEANDAQHPRSRGGGRTEASQAESTSICRFSHLSVQEYLENRHWGIQEANAFMAGVCLRTLLSLRLSGAPQDSTQRSTVSNSDDDSETENNETGDSETGDSEIEDKVVLYVGQDERLARFEVVWVEGHDEDAATQECATAEDEKDAGSSHWDSQPPPFQCFCELVNTHSHGIHDDSLSCVSADFDPYIVGYEDTAVESWAMYAAQAFGTHARQAYSETEAGSAWDYLLSEFLGSVEHSSSHYGAWAMLSQAMPETPMEVSIIQEQSPPDNSFRSVLRPISNPAFGCAALGLHQTLDRWLEKGQLEPNCTNKNGDSLLLLAVQNGHQQTSKVLLQHGADPNRPGLGGLTPLYVAVGTKQVDMVMLLLDHAADPNVSVAEVPNYPLARAVAMGDLQIAAHLFQYGADCCATYHSAFQDVPLIIASARSDTKLVSLILDYMPPQSNWKSRGIVWQALEHAAETGESSAEIIKLLMGYVKELKVSMSLHIAVQKGYWNLARALIDHGADVDMRGTEGKGHYDTPLLSLLKGYHNDVLAKARQLLDWGAAVDAEDLHGCTPLFVCLQRTMGFKPLPDENDAISAELEAKLLESNAKSVSFIAESGKILVELLLSRGANTNARDKKGTPVLIAAFLSQMITPPVLRMLIDHRADVNGRAGAEYEFMTPLDVVGLHEEEDEDDEGSDDDDEVENEDEDEDDGNETDDDDEKNNLAEITEILRGAGAKLSNEDWSDEQRSAWRREMKQKHRIKTLKRCFT